MNENLINELLSERLVCMTRIKKIEELLLIYGVDSSGKKTTSVSSEISCPDNQLIISNGTSLDGVDSENLKNQIIPKKVLFALKQIKTGTAHDVANKLCELIPGYDRQRAISDSRNWLSKSKVRGVIHAHSAGNKNIYSYP